jgi:predicted transcriptional regulator
MANNPLSIRLPEETKEKLTKLSNATGRTKSFLAVEAIEAYCQSQAWQIEAIQKGIESAEKGELVDHDTLKQKWLEKRANQMD